MNTNLKEEAFKKLEGNKNASRAPFIVYTLVVHAFIAICVLLHLVIGWLSPYAFIVDGVFLIISILLFAPLNYAVITFYSRLYKGKEVTGTEFADGYKTSIMPRAIVSFLIKNGIVLVSAVFLVFPAFILNSSFALTTTYLRKDPKLTTFAAMSKSAKSMKGHKLEYFKLTFPIAAWLLLGIITLGIGFIIGMPKLYMRHVVFYRRRIVGDTATSPNTAAPQVKHEEIIAEAEQEHGGNAEAKVDNANGIDDISDNDLTVVLTAPLNEPLNTPHQVPEFVQGFSDIRTGKGAQRNNYGEPVIVQAKPMFDEKTNPSMRYESIPQEDYIIDQDALAEMLSAHQAMPNTAGETIDPLFSQMPRRIPTLEELDAMDDDDGEIVGEVISSDEVAEEDDFGSTENEEASGNGGEQYGEVNERETERPQRTVPTQPRPATRPVTRPIDPNSPTTRPSTRPLDPTAQRTRPSQANATRPTAQQTRPTTRPITRPALTPEEQEEQRKAREERIARLKAAQK